MESIDLDFTDYKTKLAHKGRVIDLVDSCQANDFINIFDDTIKKSISFAKGILIHFQINVEQSLLEMNTILEQIYSLTDENAEIVFSTESIDIDQGIMTYQIILTGL